MTAEGDLSMDHFKAIPWCATILNDTNTVIFTPPCRLIPDKNGYCPTKDQLLRRSLKSADGIPHALAFYHRTGHSISPKTGLGFLINSATLLVQLQPGVNGYNGGAHGGLIATLLDEAMGTLIFQNHEVFKEAQVKGEAIHGNVLDMRGLAFLTASMTVRYEKPVRTPQVVTVTASLDRIVGRKVCLLAELKDERDVVLARGEGVWIAVREEGLAASMKL